MASKTIYTILIFSIFSLIPLSGQTQEDLSDVKYFNDYELDYYPHFISGNDCEFQFVFKDALKACGYRLADIKQISGSRMRRTGIPPKEWEGRTRFYILIDEKGVIQKITFNGTPIAQEIESCFIKTVKERRLNPGLKESKPVKCTFSYLLIEQTETPSKKKKRPITSAIGNGG